MDSAKRRELKLRLQKDFDLEDIEMLEFVLRRDSVLVGMLDFNGEMLKSTPIEKLEDYRQSNSTEEMCQMYLGFEEQLYDYIEDLTDDKAKFVNPNSEGISKKLLKLMQDFRGVFALVIFEQMVDIAISHIISKEMAEGFVEDEKKLPLCQEIMEKFMT